ncbi:MAG TPA: cytochrome P450 [Pseudonocardiaceae bacterium]|nr:cytochrome P450 [Pseudonocardiaceae bacterium]
MAGFVLPLIIVVIVLALLASLPYWLPARVVALRVLVFARVNGEEGVPVPGRRHDVGRFRSLYANPAANGRSRGAGLSNLFWYWLAPGPEVHQEHLEAGPRYDEVARITRQILVRGKEESERLTQACVTRVLDELPDRAQRTVRLRDLMMPVWAELYYELVFGTRCPPDVRRLIVANADDVVTALKCCGLRHMRRRERMTEYLRQQLGAGTIPHPLPTLLSAEETAQYLQGTFFNTAVVQMSEAMTHLVLAVAEHPDVQARLVADPADTDFLDRVIDETFRMYPLFGIAHRITTADIDTGPELLPAGSVLLFNYPEYHRVGYDHSEVYDPDRWLTLAAKDSNFIPFGVTANRACPARGLAPVTMRVVLREVLRRYQVASSAAHTRSIPNRGPCLLVDRRLAPGPRRGSLARLRLADRWADVWRSLTQLVFGSYMVWDARRKSLCDNYFAQLGDGTEGGTTKIDAAGGGAAGSVASGRCPFPGPADSAPRQKEGDRA